MQKFILNPRDIFQYVCVEAPAGRFCVGGRLRPISPAQNFRNKTDFTPSFCVFREQRVKNMKIFAPLLLAVGTQAGVGSRVVEMVKGY